MSVYDKDVARAVRPHARIRIAFGFICLLATPVVSAVALLPQRIIDAPENSWVRLNDNLWPSVWPEPGKSAYHGTPVGVVRAWSSFAWDDKRGDLILWGGGHANYSGNEIYRWRSSTMRWELSSLPSAVNCVGAKCVTRDGPANSPISAHTYDNSAYLSTADRFITFGGNKYNQGGSFYMDGHPTGPYLWDPDRADGSKVGGLDGSNRDPSVQGGRMWENRNPWGRLPVKTRQTLLRPSQDSRAATAVTVIGGKDVIYQSRTKALLKYTINDVNDPGKDTWEVAWDGVWHEGMYGQGAMSIDPTGRLMVRTSGSTIYGFRVQPSGNVSGPFKIRPIDLTGAFPFTKMSLMGLDYDAQRDRFLMWKGMDEMWSLYRDDVTGWVIDRVDPLNLIGGNSPDSLRGFNGILGKWKYADDWDVFVGMYDWLTGDVLAYKPAGWNPNAKALRVSGGSSAPTDPTPPTPTDPTPRTPTDPMPRTPTDPMPPNGPNNLNSLAAPARIAFLPEPAAAWLVLLGLGAVVRRTRATRATL